MLDGLVGHAYVVAVLLVLQIEFSLLGDVTDREGDAVELAVVFVDRVYAHLGVAVDATLDDDTLRTEIEFFHMTVAQEVAEGGHVEQRFLVVVGILFRLEVQDLTHLLVGREQTAVLVIEGQSYERLLEDTAIFVGHLLFFFLKQDLFRTVCQCAEDVDGADACCVGILSNALVFHIAPLAQFLLTTHVPTEDTLVHLFLTRCQAFDELPVDMTVVRMNQLKTLFIVHAVVRQEISMNVDGMPLTEIKHQHVVLTHIEGVLHDG